MTRGLLDAGIDVIAGIDIDDKCLETYETNNSPSRFIRADITRLRPESLEGRGSKTNETQIVTGLKRDDDEMLFAGCSPCQFWSLINTEKKKAEKSKNLLADFQRFIDYFNPGYVLIENVPGLANRQGSPLDSFIDFLSSKGYFSISKAIIKVSDYGVPQSRKRFVLLASRVKNVRLPTPEPEFCPTVRNFIGDKSVFPAIAAGHRDNSEFCHTTARLSPMNLKRIQNTTKDGGTRKDWKDTNLQLKVYEKNDGLPGFISEITKSSLSPNRKLRLISIYTGNADLNNVLDSMFTSLTNAGLTPQLDRDAFHISIDDAVHIVVYAKQYAAIPVERNSRRANKQVLALRSSELRLCANK